jgi:hypothetical protein
MARTDTRNIEFFPIGLAAHARTNPETGLPVTPEQALEELRAFDPLLAKMAFEPGGNGGAAPH